MIGRAREELTGLLFRCTHLITYLYNPYKMLAVYTLFADLNTHAWALLSKSDFSTGCSNLIVLRMLPVRSPSPTDCTPICTLPRRLDCSPADAPEAEALADISTFSCEHSSGINAIVTSCSYVRMCHPRPPSSRDVDLSSAQARQM